MAAALTQQTTGRSAAVSFRDIPLSGVASGALLVLHVGTFAEAGSPTVTGGGATWVEKVARVDSGGQETLHIWEGYNSTGGSVTVRFTCGTGTADIAQILTEWSGMPTTDPADVQASAPNVGTSTTPDSGATAATAQADELALSGCIHNGGTITMVARAGDGYTDLTGQTAGASGMVIGGAYKVLSATGAQSGRFTLGASQQWAAGVMALKAAAGGAATSLVMPHNPLAAMVGR